MCLAAFTMIKFYSKTTALIPVGWVVISNFWGKMPEAIIELGKQLGAWIDETYTESPSGMLWGNDCGKFLRNTKTGAIAVKNSLRHFRSCSSFPIKAAPAIMIVGYSLHYAYSTANGICLFFCYCLEIGMVDGCWNGMMKWGKMMEWNDRILGWDGLMGLWNNGKVSIASQNRYRS